MSYIVEMVRGNPGEPNHQIFACGGTSWKQILFIAKNFGWNPKGTIQDEKMARFTSEYDKYFKPTYDPEEWAHCKRITDEDAQNLANCLIAASVAISSGQVIIATSSDPAIFSNNFTQAELQNINKSSVDLLQKFANFALGGSFAFAWDD